MTNDEMVSNTDASRRRFLRATAGIGAAVGFSGTATAQETTTTEDQGQAVEVRVKQDAGQLTYWVLPGKRRLSKRVFGTPDDPKSLVEPVIEKAQKKPIKQLLRKNPGLVGVPEDKREVEDGEYTTTTFNTPFGDQGRVVDGEFDITYVDRQQNDSGKPTQTKDELQVDKLRFTDPENNNYELRFRTLFAPPIPGYETGGGLFTDRFHHGLTGTGSPMMPKVYTYGATYSIGDVVVNGDVASERRVIHWMTTQTVRDQNYNLAIDEELPLRPENTIAGQLHHTHLIVFPVKVTEQGVPQFAPVGGPTGQPFIHVMFEEDTVEAPFEPQFQTEFETTTAETTTQAAEEGAIDVQGSEYTFDPEQFSVEQGREVTVRFRNVGTIAHNFTLPAFDAQTPTILPGERASVTFTPEETGEFTYICAVPGHAQEGMEGTLTVTPTGEATDTGEETITTDHQATTTEQQ